MPTQQQIDEADEKVRTALREWLALFGRDNPAAVMGDFAAVVHFKEFKETIPGEPLDMVDRYEALYNWGISYHSVIGLLNTASEELTLNDQEDDE